MREEILYGINPVVESIKSGRRQIFSLFLKEGVKKGGQLLDLARQKHIQVSFHSLDKIAKLSSAEGHQGICAKVSPYPYSDFEKILSRLEGKKSARLVFLDGVQDPRNLGAIIRSASVFGIDALVIPSSKAAQYTSSAAKSSAGAGEHTTICRVNNIATAISSAGEAGFHMVAMESNGNEGIESLRNHKKLGIVLGGEGTGVREMVKKRCSGVASIPMDGTIGSLNVSTAGAIVFYTSVYKP